MAFGVLLAIKILYSMKNGVLFLEGLQEPKPIPYFNFIRFFPPINLLEFVLGMLIGLLVKQADSKQSLATMYAPVMLLLAIALLLLVRVFLPINDMLARTLFLTPLFLAFLYFVSFSHGRFLKGFESNFWIFLGEISFSLYCVHGALGQLFYKKAVKTMLMMPDVPYAMFLFLLFVAATILYFGVERRWVNLSQARTDKSKTVKWQARNAS